MQMKQKPYDNPSSINPALTAASTIEIRNSDHHNVLYQYILNESFTALLSLIVAP